MATKKQSRSKVQGVVNPRGVTAIYGTPIDFKALPEKITIGRRVANGKFKLEAHYPAKHFNDKQTYVDKRKEGSYCRFYDKKSPFFIARTVWDATSQPGMHMIVKNRGETHRFIVTPKVDDPTKASVIGSYLVHRDNGDPVLCSGVIGELEAAGDDGDFKVTPYQNHGIRCPKFDDQKKELAGHIPQTFEYKKSTKPRGPRKTAADYCKPTHTFKHPTDIKKAEMIADMDDEMDDAVSCLKCRWDGSYEDLVFVDADGTGGGGYDFHLACPVCEEDEWLDDMMAEGVDEPCFSCDGIGHWDDGDCGYCEGSGLMSDTLRAEMAMFNNEYFDADCGCFKKAEHKTLSFMDWAKQEEASHLKKYGAEGEDDDLLPVGTKVRSYDFWVSQGKDSSYIEGVIEKIAPSPRCAPDCMYYHIRTTKTVRRGEEINEDAIGEIFMTHPYEDFGWTLKQRKGIQVLDAEDEDWERPRKDAELCPNFDTAKGPLSGPCWDCEVCTKNGMTQEKLQTLIDSGWFHKDGTPKADKDGKALLNIEPGEPYVKSGLPAHPRGSGLLGHRPSDYDLRQYDAQTFEAPYAGAGALMGIKGDSALSSFTPSELTESSAIHGDFDQASLNYSGHQNLEVRAEDGMEGVGYPVEWEDVRRDMKYPKEDNNNGLIYGVEWMDGEEIVDISWFKTEAERDAELKESKEWHIKEYGAENRKPPWSATNPMPNRRWECGECDAKGVIAGEICTTCDGDGFWMIPSPRCATCDSDIEWTDGAECEDCEEWVCNDCMGEDYSCPKCKTTDLSFHAEGLGKDSCCCGATKSKPCACMKTGAKCSGSCACSTKEAEYDRPTPKWAKPLGLIGGLAAGYISAQMIDNAKE